MTPEADCVFCSIASGLAPATVVHEDELTVAFLPTRPAVLGHTLIIPRRHIRDFWAAESDDIGPVIAAAVTVGRGVQRALKSDGMNLISSAGEAATQSVFHLHLHVVPRWHDDRMGRIWPARRECPEAERNQVADQIRTALTDGSIGPAR